jgi:hypothetical protein
MKSLRRISFYAGHTLLLLLFAMHSVPQEGHYTYDMMQDAQRARNPRSSKKFNKTDSNTDP